MLDYKSLIRRYYSELWNTWSLAALEELISPAIVFRGSIGTTVNGIEEFKRYVDKIRAAFPDFHNHIEELIGEGEKVVARLTYTGSHQGELFGFPGTGKKISYQGVGIFQFREGKIVSGFVLGDTENLKRQIAQP
ncbi:MAG TPA: ester cyclase [Candidatus Dormibacteraeota bacterium]|nr:ester cyclase [Candidatus Dormibacteraeota bacterium]